MEHVNNIASGGSVGGSSFSDLSGAAEPDCNECCICLERKPEVSLPCAHSYCTPCIEQWNIHQKKCPICDEELASTDDTWVLSEMPEAEEISEEICATLMKLSVDKDPNVDTRFQLTTVPPDAIIFLIIGSGALLLMFPINKVLIGPIVHRRRRVRTPPYRIYR
ncbi:hypothetical protein quinque_015041 [Culex quinquefasciatus]